MVLSLTEPQNPRAIGLGEVIGLGLSALSLAQNCYAGGWLLGLGFSKETGVEADLWSHRWQLVHRSEGDSPGDIGRES